MENNAEKIKLPSEISQIIDEFFAKEAELFRKEHPKIIEKILKENSGGAKK